MIILAGNKLELNQFDQYYVIHRQDIRIGLNRELKKTFKKL